MAQVREELSRDLSPLDVTLVILCFLWVDFRGVSETGKVGNIVTLAKISILMLFIGSGLWAITAHPDYLLKFQDFAPYGWGGAR